MAQSKRRTYSEEFKQEAVKLVSEQGYTVFEAAQNLGVCDNTLRSWLKKFAAPKNKPTLTEDEQMELAQLRAENKRLRMERDILKKAAAFFANEKN